MVSAADLVRWMGAVQAQEYDAARWGLGQRMRRASDSAIRAAVDRGDILRTHVLRPTWHFVTPADIRWMLALTGPRVLASMASYSRTNGIDPPLVSRAFTAIERVLAGRSLTRVALGAELTRRGIRLRGIPLALMTMHAEANGVICSGPFEGRTLTYALLEERAPATAPLTREEAVIEIARRFFQSHGPATLRDFSWWSGLPMADGRRGLDALGGRGREVNGLTYWTVGPSRPPRRLPHSTHLLPIYDEYLVAYRDREAVSYTTTRASAVTFQHALIIDGQIHGTWRTRRTGARTSLSTHPLQKLTAGQKRDVTAAVSRYCQFVASPVAVTH